MMTMKLSINTLNISTYSIDKPALYANIVENSFSP